MFAEWHDSHSVGISILDDQHKRLFSLINTLHESFGKGNDKEIVINIISELVEFAKDHFSTEERLMLDHEYPDFKEHVKEHEEITANVNNLSKRRHLGDEKFPEDVMNLMIDWLHEHVSKTDAAYGPYLNSKGVV